MTARKSDASRQTLTSSPACPDPGLEGRPFESFDAGWPFRDSAFAYREAGLFPVPAHDKEPNRVRWGRMKHRPSLKTLQDWADKWPRDNIGILTGKRSGVFIVDCDDPELVPEMIRRFGDPAIISQTPSGGVHLWYAWSGERCGNLRSEDYAVDLKGEGGFIVVPPSVRMSGEHAGKPYQFKRGSLADLEKLKPAKAPQQGLTPEGRVPVGSRDTALHRHLPRHAVHCDTREQLLDLGASFVRDQCEDPNGLLYGQPLTEAQIRATVHSVWKCQTEGRNWVGKRAHVSLSPEEFDKLNGHPNEAMLYLTLRHNNGARGEFVISSRAMAKENVIPGWSRHRYYHARCGLERLGLIRCVHRGGSKPGDPSRFVWG